jgi:serine phosphatase RsbU (regulator of sigma subunit)
VLVAPDGRPELLMGGRSAPLGVVLPDVPRPQATVDLVPGAGLVLVTDGLVERRGETIDAALERLLDAVRASPATAPAQLVRVLLDRCLPAGAGVDDDVCLLSLRRRPEPAPAAHGTA